MLKKSQKLWMENFYVRTAWEEHREFKIAPPMKGKLAFGLYFQSCFFFSSEKSVEVESWTKKYSLELFLLTFSLHFSNFCWTTRKNRRFPSVSTFPFHSSRHFSLVFPLNSLLNFLENYNASSSVTPRSMFNLLGIFFFSLTLFTDGMDFKLTFTQIAGFLTCLIALWWYLKS